MTGRTQAGYLQTQAQKPENQKSKIKNLRPKAQAILPGGTSSSVTALKNRKPLNWKFRLEQTRSQQFLSKSQAPLPSNLRATLNGQKYQEEVNEKVVFVNSSSAALVCVGGRSDEPVIAQSKHTAEHAESIHHQSEFHQSEFDIAVGSAAGYLVQRQRWSDQRCYQR